MQCHPVDCVVATSGIDNTIKVRMMNGFFFFGCEAFEGNLVINDS